MNLLAMGRPFWGDTAHLGGYRSASGHEVRYLALETVKEDVYLDGAHYRFHANETAEEIVTRVSREWRVDAFACFFPELYPSPLRVEDCPVKTVAGVSDWNLYFPQLEFNLSRFDLVLTDKLGAAVLPLKGAKPQHLFPLYSHMGSVHCDLGLERDIDILFVGNLNHLIHVQRGKCLEAIASLSEKYTVAICSFFYGDDYAHLLNRAKIVFNHSVRQEMNMRCYEAMACGALLFLEEDNLETGEYIEHGQHAIFYTYDNLLESLDYYMQHPEECRAIAERGSQRAIELEGINRIDRFIDWLAAQPSGERAFRAMPEPEKETATILQYATSLLPEQQAYASERIEMALTRYPNRPDTFLAAGCDAFNVRGAGAQEKPDRSKRILEYFRKAAELDPRQIVPWLNLALACRLANAHDAEERMLDQALTASSCGYGPFFIGKTSDPYYVAWRLAIAMGEQRIEILKASAAARLAELRSKRGEFVAARKYALDAIAWLPHAVPPYRTCADAETMLDNHEAAVRLLEQALPKSAFDSDLRLELINAYLAVGRNRDARAVAEESARLFAACPQFADTMRQFMRIAGEIPDSA